MYSGITIGLDLAKNVFQLYGVNEKGKNILNKRLLRKDVSSFFAQLPSSVVAMEACGSSLYWARTIEELGHVVRRIPAQYTSVYRRGNKTDATDAAAICEAAQRPGMTFVANKSQEQTDIQSIHRIRESLISMRTMIVNQIRGQLAENGIVLAKGIGHIKELPTILESMEYVLSDCMRRLLHEQYRHIQFVNEQIADREAQLRRIARENESCAELMRIPGIGVICATAIYYTLGNSGSDKTSRQFTSYIGLTPKEHSSGGKRRLGPISKRGDTYLRKMLIQGSRSMLWAIMRKPITCNEPALFTWVRGIEATKGVNRAAVALANKVARAAFIVLSRKVSFKAEMLCSATVHEERNRN